ncbi:multidrug efflux MFS transporter [Oenococcus sicerae]|uniref:DHA2 family efflux MFS transporter permease subunit n=1 Tax=Oenococcus sicerae TaxID=2203724 RepID=A0AAJ1RC58_9LACO|nr:DHA2 family efflux MFS transporter permease subunit [Oenococcus sicerae]MDN6900225.1 DHA2 family efflux MFS transporter permease subunit [Oenococcus sicerae]QAS69807.1 multidrug efflux MFS transporter [Oenococcus sicerae]
MNKNLQAITAAGLLSFIGILVQTSLNVTFPTLIQQFHESLNTVQWLTTGYLLMVTITMGSSAYLLKRFSARNIFILAISAFVLGTLLCIFTDNFIILMIGRLFQAIATGLSTPLLFQLIFTTLAAEYLGTYTGLASMIISLAPALGPTYGGLLNTYLNWRFIFWIALPLGFISLLLGIKTIKLPHVKEHVSFDFFGFVLLISIFTGFIWSFNQAGKHGWQSPSFIGFLLISLALTVLYVVYNQHSKRRLLDYSILKQAQVRLGAFNFFVLQFANVGSCLVIPLFAENVLKGNALVAGFLLFPGSVLGAFMSPVAGRLYDRQGAFKPLVLGNGLLLISTILLALLSDKLTLLSLTLLYCLLRLGFTFSFGNVLSEGTTYVAAEQKADLNSLYNMLQQYAGSIGTQIMAAFISASELSAGQDIRLATLKGSQIDFWLLTLLALLALITVYYEHYLTQKKIAKVNSL